MSTWPQGGSLKLSTRLGTNRRSPGPLGALPSVRDGEALHDRREGSTHLRWSPLPSGERLVAALRLRIETEPMEHGGGFLQGVARRGGARDRLLGLA